MRLIDADALSKEIESLYISMTGVRSGKGILAGVMNEYKKTVLRVIDEQPTASDKNGWISCSERLPEEGEDVLVFFEYFRHGSYNRLFQTIGISYTYDGKWSGFVNGSSGWSQLDIIAWQPLPKPYKEQATKADFKEKDK